MSHTPASPREPSAWRAPLAYFAGAAVLIAISIPVQQALHKERTGLVPVASGDPKVVAMNALGPGA